MKNFTPIVFCTALLLFAHSLKSQCSSPVALPYFNGFEADSIGSAPQCLTYVSPAANSYCRVLGGGWQGNKSLYFEGTAGPGYGQGWLFFPAMNFDSGKVYRVSLQYTNGGDINYGRYDYPVDLRYGNSPTVAAMTNYIASTYLWPNIYTALNGSVKTNGGQFYIGLKFTTSYDVPLGLNIDNFSVYEAVAPPCPLSIKDITIYTDGVDLTKSKIKWSKPAGFSTDDLFEWELRTTADPGSGSDGLVTAGAITDTSISLANLNQNIRYYIYVRAICGSITAGSWEYKRFKTSIPESQSMALPIVTKKYENNPSTSGPMSIANFPLANYSIWYSFVPDQESNTLQIRNKRMYYGSYGNNNLNVPVKYDIYKAADELSNDSLITGYITYPHSFNDSFCYAGNCKALYYSSGGDHYMPALVPGKKYYIQLSMGSVSGYPIPNYYLMSFDASIFKSDVWFGNSVGVSRAEHLSKPATTLSNWNPLINEVGYKEDMKMFAELNPLGRTLGNISALCSRNSTNISKDIYNTKILDRTYRITSTAQPNGNIKIRLYFTKQELQRFTDSTGKTINNLRITQNYEPVYLYNYTSSYFANYLIGGTQIIPDTGSYDSYKYLEFTTDKLGNFYIHGDSVRLPIISEQPISKTVCPGTVINLSSNAVNGLPAPLIQWQQSINGGITWTNIANAKSATYTFTQTEEKNAVLYRAAWSNTAGTIYSNPVIVRNVLVAALSAPCCAGGNVIETSNTGISQITWLYNNSPVSTQNFDYTPNAITVAGGNGSGSAANQFTNPFSVATDTAGNVYVADAGNHRIQIFAPGNATGTTVAGGNGAGVSSNQLNNPRSVFVDATGNLYFADAGNNRIQKWLANALSGTTIAGGNGAGSAANQLDFPHGVFADAVGNIYVADGNNNRIQKFVPGSTNGVTVAGGNGAGSAANQLSYATGVFVDTAGNVYVNDFANNRVQKWAPNAVTGVTVAGGNGAGSAANQLSSPRSIYVDCNNAVYIADQSNNRIQKWLPGATTGTTIAGGNADGSNANQLSSPAAVFEDGKGNLLVADRLNQRIQQFSLPKTATYTINEGGAYKAIVTGTGCCSVNTQQVIINAANGPVICPGSSTYFVSQNSASGNTYQWQVNSENGFVNITDNTIYNGATSDTLKLIVPSTAWYGYKFRSVINGTTYSPEYVLKFAVNWTGNNSTAWENAANWNCGVLPDENTDVIINAGLANYPLVNVNSVCGSLKLMPGTAVTVKTGIKLDVKRK